MHLFCANACDEENNQRYNTYHKKYASPHARFKNTTDNAATFQARSKSNQEGDYRKNLYLFHNLSSGAGLIITAPR